MAFPTIPTVAASRVVTGVQANTTATRTFPNLSGLTKNSGDLLIAIVVAYDGNTTDSDWSAWTAGWTEFLDSSTSATISIGAAYKWSDGTETGTIQVTQSGLPPTGHAAFILLSIPGAHASTPPTWGGRADGTTAIADPGAVDPAGWAAEDTLWIAVGVCGETSTTGSFTGMAGNAPTNYSNLAATGISSDVVGGVEGAVAFRQLNAASENAGPYSAIDTSNARNAALVIAVRPANVVTVAKVTETGTAQPIVAKKIRVVGQATEADVARAITVDSGGPLLTRTDRIGALSNATGDFSGGTGAWTTAAFTPSNNSLLVVSAFAHGSSGGSTNNFATGGFTISDSAGLTWTERAVAYGDAADTPFDIVAKIWSAPVVTGASMTLTFDAGGKDVALYAVSAVDYTDYDTSSPVGATGSNNQDTGFTGPPDPAAATLSAAPATSSEVFAAVGISKSTADTTPGSGWTEIHDLENTAWGGIQSQIRGGSTSTSVAWTDLRPGGGALFTYAAVAVEIKEATSGQTATAGKATETDASNAITRLKSRAATQATETDASNAVTRSKTKTASQATSTAAANAITRVKTKTVGQAVETDVARTIFVAPIKIPVGKATETDQATALTRIKTGNATRADETDQARATTSGKTKSVSAAGETEVANSVVRLKTTTVARVDETGLARAITSRKTLVVGQATETDVARPINTVGNIQVGKASETDLAQPIGRAKIAKLGDSYVDEYEDSYRSPMETDVSRAIVRNKSKIVGQATEVDVAQPITSSGPDLIPVGQATETDIARAISAIKIKTVGQSSEADTAQGATRAKTRTTAQAVESDVARTITTPGNIIIPVGKATETDVAFATVTKKIKTISQANEADSSLTVVRVRSKIVGFAVETDAARQIARSVRVAKSAEIAVALAITSVKTKIVSKIVETGAARSVARAIRLDRVVELDVARQIISEGMFPVVKTTETDVAFAIVPRKSRVVEKVTPNWEFAWPMRVVTFSGTADELDVQRRHTVAFIETSPVMITLIPRWRIKQPTGGYRLVEQGPRAPQQMVLSSLVGGEITIQTVSGTQRETKMILIGRWDANIGLDDRFALGGKNYVIENSVESNGWEQRAVVTRLA